MRKIVEIIYFLCYTKYAQRNIHTIISEGGIEMKHIKTLKTKKLNKDIKKGGCGECQTSCQSACKTSCTVGNQSCEKKAD